MIRYRSVWYGAARENPLQQEGHGSRSVRRSTAGAQWYANDEFFLFCLGSLLRFAVNEM